MTIENYREEIRDKLKTLCLSFDTIGWEARILEEGDFGFDAFDGEETYHYNNPDSDSGLFMIIRPKIDFKTESMKCVLHINNFVLSKKKRGKGLANNIIAEIIEVFEPENIAYFEFADFSNGFWEHIAKKFPQVEFKAEEI